MNTHHPLLWRAPAGPWSASFGGVDLPPGALVSPGREYRVRLVTLCGDREVDLEVVSKETEPVAVLVRRAQLCASIHHVLRRACVACRNAYQYALSPLEKRYLYSTDPALGPALGMGYEEISVTPEENARRARAIAERAEASMAGTKRLTDFTGKSVGNG